MHFTGVCSVSACDLPVTARFDRRLLGLVLLAGAPALVTLAVLLWVGSYSILLTFTVLLFLVLAWLWVAFAARRLVVRPLRTVGNLLAGLREGHFTLRARGTTDGDPLSDVFREVNALGGMLQEQRLGAVEADALLRRVMEEIDVAVFAFAGDHTLQLANRAGQQLLGQPVERLLGRTAEYLGLDGCLTGNTPRMMEQSFLGGIGRWEVRRRSFRQGGLPMEMVVLADVSRVVREEERQAWRRLIRVLSHEINNSLAPIKSLAGTLAALLERSPRPDDCEEDLTRGLEVIAARAESLDRFMAAYARLAKLPAPVLDDVEVETWVRRVAALEARIPVRVEPGPPLTIRADGDQLDQVLINLVKNAADAALETGGDVTIGWNGGGDGSEVEVWVRDSGPGIASPTNIFVPFFTTKRNGSGIGLTLSRQVAEAHGGTLTLQNRPGEEGTGCIATLRLPSGATSDG